MHSCGVIRLMVALMNDSEQIRHAFEDLFTKTIQFREYGFVSISDNSVDCSLMLPKQ